MAETTPLRVLTKLDAIRENQVRDSAMLDEIRYILRLGLANFTPNSPPASIPTPAPTTAPGMLLERAERWLSRLKPVAMVGMAMGRHAINAMVIVWMAKGGTLGPAEPYVRYLLGMG